MRRQRGSFRLGILVIALAAFPALAIQAAQYGRSEWLYDDGNRALVQTERGRWTEFLDDRPARHFDEIDRNGRYVELYTGAPQPTWVRIHPRQVFWRADGDWDWRPGRTGRWVR